METTRYPSICRVCQNLCSVEVEIEDGRAVAVHGDRQNPIYLGYTCIKGRAHPALYEHPGRLTQSLKRSPDGDVRPIPTIEAIAEIAERLGGIVDRHGPRSLAMFWGSYFALDNAVNMPMADAFMKAVGSPMVFTPNTIDQPGKTLAKGLHGVWMAPGQAAHDPEVVLIVGSNPLVSHQGFNGHPGKPFKDLARRGGRLIVIDPRRTETAKRASLHLQPRPGQDAVILAGLLRAIIEEQLYDPTFVEENVTGFDDLRIAVEPFTAAYVAERADIDPHDLLAAARAFGGRRRGYAAAGTGPNMAGHGTLVEYLILCLDTICGHWLREGEAIRNAITLVPEFMLMAKAQALPPFPTFGYGEKLRVRDLTQTLAGMPTGALADEILMPGEGQVHALLSLGGNPVTCIPDGQKMFKALSSLDLLVQVDVQMSPTASMADYVIPAKLPFEMPTTNILVDFLSLYTNGWGFAHSFAQYAPALVDPPDGADVIEQWKVLYRLAQRMSLKLDFFPGVGDLMPGGVPTPLDMAKDYTSDELLELVHAGSRVPLDEVKRHSSGALFPDPSLVVAPKDPGWEGRLDVGNADMMSDLRTFTEPDAAKESTNFPFRLISRRMMHVFNSPGPALPAERAPYNPAFLHPSDLAALDLRSGDLVALQSERDTILAVAEADPTVRPLTVSMTHSFGRLPGTEGAVREVGSNPGRLAADDVVYDRYSGQPRMSNIPVRVSPAR